VSDDAAPQSVDEGRATHRPFAHGEPEQQAPRAIDPEEKRKRAGGEEI
jgi:hypothetical protein